MTPELVAHYAARLQHAADMYEREPSPEWAWALVLALSLARLHGVSEATAAPIVRALEAHETEILEAALDYGLVEDYGQHCEEYAQRADYCLDEWEEQAAGFLVLHFELQAVHDWVADRVLASENLLPRLAPRLEQLGSAVGSLATAIERHQSLFGVEKFLHKDLLENGDRRYMTDAYKLLRRGERELPQLPAAADIDEDEHNGGE